MRESWRVWLCTGYLLVVLLLHIAIVLNGTNKLIPLTHVETAVAVGKDEATPWKNASASANMSVGKRVSIWYRGPNIGRESSSDFAPSSCDCWINMTIISMLTCSATTSHTLLFLKHTETSVGKRTCTPYPQVSTTQVWPVLRQHGVYTCLEAEILKQLSTVWWW